MGPKYEPRSKIYDLDPIEADDELDLVSHPADKRQSKQTAKQCLL